MSKEGDKLGHSPEFAFTHSLRRLEVPSLLAVLSKQSDKTGICVLCKTYVKIKKIPDPEHPDQEIVVKEVVRQYCLVWEERMKQGRYLDGWELYETYPITDPNFIKDLNTGVYKITSGNYEPEKR